jgi:hypothetical protein
MNKFFKALLLVGCLTQAGCYATITPVVAVPAVIYPAPRVYVRPPPMIVYPAPPVVIHPQRRFRR